MVIGSVELFQPTCGWLPAVCHRAQQGTSYQCCVPVRYLGNSYGNHKRWNCGATSCCQRRQKL